MTANAATVLLPKTVLKYSSYLTRLTVLYMMEKIKG